jgi:hypothetical protein
MLGSACWLALLLPEATSSWFGQVLEQGHEEGDSNTMLQAVAMAAAMMKRRKLVIVNMSNRMHPGESQVHSTLCIYMWSGHDV